MTDGQTADGRTMLVVKLLSRLKSNLIATYNIQNIINLKKSLKERMFADNGDCRVALATKINSVFYLIDKLVEFFMRI